MKLVDIMIANYDARKSDEQHIILTTIHLKLWSLREDKRPVLKDCQTISYQQEDLQPASQKSLDVPLKNISQHPLDDIISFSQDLCYMRIGHHLFSNRTPNVSLSFEVLLEDREPSKVCRGRLACGGSYLISAQTKTLESSKDIFSIPTFADRIYSATELGE